MAEATESVYAFISASGVKTTATVFMMTLALIKIATMFNGKRYKLPPGPRGLPIFGYLPFFGQKPHVTFNEMRKTYGDVISIQMGSWPAIVINGRDAIKEALVNKGDDFSGRPAFTTARFLNDGRNFAFSVFGPTSKMHRKIVSKVMYNFTNARKNPIEDIIRSDAKDVIKEFLAYGNKSFCPLIPLEVAAASMVYQLCYGRHQNIREDKAFMEVLDGSRKFQKFTGAGNPVDVMPWLRFILPGKVTTFLEFIQEQVVKRCEKVEQHENDFDENNLRDITDGLIHAGNTLSAEEKAVGMDKRRVLESLDAIYGAGGATVASTLQWGVHYMAAFPEVQERVFQKINSVVGQGRDITLADRSNLSLVEATLFETLRFSAAIPFALPHATTCDTTLQGFDIPKDTVVLVNLYSIQMDTDFWGDPENFRPERFLDSNGELDRGVVEHLATFSLGRRRCIGEALARTESFLFFATLLQHLKFSKPPGYPGYTFEATFGISNDPKPFDVCVSPRE